ncbi:antibiotic biosynthesis monooxygenase [Thalassomonas haliotis]|uniref:Antibiotic biosynthesis monooxygenase n=1 Tax=Thalassomonas haliotis TaxID=485448 RepID=A0ABY7VI82_9GAMM|nr:antibiotic biosynthesis monooxygenase [Thalassomonas haliotis]WDE12745.1 antibiotic biosynthesis monooxygenase [Thalassomonas haliotis]
MACFSVLSVKAQAVDEQQPAASTKFAMQAVLVAQAGKGDGLAEIMLPASALVSKMEDCHLYLRQQSLTDNGKVVMSELWDDKTAHKTLLKNAKVRRFITRAKAMIVAMEHNPAKYLGDMLFSARGY